MDYWVNRLDKQKEILYDKEVEATEKRLVQYYLSAQEKTQRDIEKLYDMLLAEAKDGKIKANDLYKYNRYFELMNKVNERLTALGHAEIKIYNEKFLQMYEMVQTAITTLSPSGISNVFIQGNTAEAVLKSVWCADGKHWSERVWQNKLQLQEAIEQGLVDCVVRGVPKDELVKTLKERFSVGFSQADRITRTELSYVQNQSTLDRYKAAGIKQYKILAAKDSRTSEICRKQNGKIYNMEDAKAGVNMPPFHPNCRSTIIPVLEV